ncbi:hypothetical protein BCR44DRAFT_384350 [Catenaria anguillulae PL171]|uniref:Uncharacterized protein n=1 Tax=Catenaria anguillulae PL171 TaxID=765915 RepID=A0A1Y2HX86_9FUNG|nr:hypothetical protein BCR44DRAFT_384350 [Catenaria anguillulae PL171]
MPRLDPGIASFPAADTTNDVQAPHPTHALTVTQSALPAIPPILAAQLGQFIARRDLATPSPGGTRNAPRTNPMLPPAWTAMAVLESPRDAIRAHIFARSHVLISAGAIQVTGALGSEAYRETSGSGHVCMGAHQASVQNGAHIITALGL